MVSTPFVGELPELNPWGPCRRGEVCLVSSCGGRDLADSGFDSSFARLLNLDLIWRQKAPWSDVSVFLGEVCVSLMSAMDDMSSGRLAGSLMELRLRIAPSTGLLSIAGLTIGVRAGSAAGCAVMGQQAFDEKDGMSQGETSSFKANTGGRERQKESVQLASRSMCGQFKLTRLYRRSIQRAMSVFCIFVASHAFHTTIWAGVTIQTWTGIRR